MPHQYKEIKDYDYLYFIDSKLPKLNEQFIENIIDKYFINDNKALIIRNHFLFILIIIYGQNIMKVWHKQDIIMNVINIRILLSNN